MISMLRGSQLNFLSVLLVTSFIHHVQLAKASDIAVAKSSLPRSRFSDDWCLARGFDPSNLSCDTCRLLEESITLQNLQKRAQNGNEAIDLGAECRSCCQAHKVNPMLRPDESLRGKYRYALLTYDQTSLDQFGEIKDFLERDANDILSFKGEHRFQFVESERSGFDADMARMMMMGIMMGSLGTAPKLMLFEKQKVGGWKEEDEEEAGEVITLRGWKRDDLKDMLMTLLPNA